MVEDIRYKTLVYQAKDPQFDVEQIGQYHLFIRWHGQGFDLSVVDEQAMKWVLFESHRIEPASSPSAHLARLQHIWNAHHCLNAGFWGHVTVVAVDTTFVLVPSALFAEEALPHLLSLNAEADLVSQVLHYTQLSELGIHSGFVVEKQTEMWVHSLYSANARLHFQHGLAAFVQALFRQGFLNPAYTGHLFVHVVGDHLMVAAPGQDGLLFANVFQAALPEDQLYFLLLAAEETGIGHAQAKLEVWGLTDEQAPLMLYLRQYFPHVSFGKRPTGIGISNAFDELPATLAFDLLGLYGRI